MEKKRKPVGSGWKRLFLKGVFLSGLGVIVIVAALYGTVRCLTPAASIRQEIAPGVFYQAFETDSPHARGAIMVVEVHWETPGVNVELRPFTDRALDQGRHYTLTFADWVVARRGDMIAFINGTRYTPADYRNTYPGNEVSTVESVVIDGVFSHLHENSYLLWWDSEGNATFETTKPPSEKAQGLARMGIGVQGIGVQNGQSRHQSMVTNETDESRPRSFIGVDSERKVLWLIGFETATIRFMTEFAARQGVMVGGMLDTGTATTMLVGRAADGVRPFTGIRNPRPLGNYISIHFQKPGRE